MCPNTANAQEQDAWMLLLSIQIEKDTTRSAIIHNTGLYKYCTDNSFIMIQLGQYIYIWVLATKNTILFNNYVRLLI